ncbi:unnamed protein product [Rotaria socialis]|uniref:Cardiolipin synthase N-terminal domain-containing protein n=2 Tax=Rotaria socialis TaxID=392032 RepID=A0A820VEM6_9BILA|nr:unnamed protein product [Rotaria socialis]CAF3440858.1 unnamed protein product [Rotaria socialis]CAF3659362.1 unnamed protein product [Rotaria socialis]CAF4432982.1 unnamed protein product [Rotaria socialis]CAF4498982.1 unnamed protein product [Rotaria socialis]
MSFIMKPTPILILLLACIDCVAADYHSVASTIGGLLGLIILILDVIAAIEIFRSGKTLIEKVLWVLFIFFFPIIGLVVYLLLGRNRSLGI